jgi:tRNA 2-thiouridine synthesizing protein A
MLESKAIAAMIRRFARFDDRQDDNHSMSEKTLNLRGLKCPLPALRTRKALRDLQPADILVVECTDPLTAIDIPNLINQTGDTLEETQKEKKLLTFRIRKK